MLATNGPGTSAATQLLGQGHKELADQALAEATRIDRGGGASAAGTKTLEYGTRKLTQLLDQVPFPVEPEAAS